MAILRVFLLFAVFNVAAPLAAAAPTTTTEIRLEEFQRLSTLTDRDNVTAAVWIALPPVSGGALPNGFDAFEKRIAGRFPSDPQVLFALATVCQQVERHCADAHYHDALVRAEPQNAINWLLLPDHGAPDAAQLQSASTAQYVDSNLRSTLRVVRAALSAAGRDPHVIAEIAASVPLPEFRGFVQVCKTAASAPVAQCVAIAKRFVDDRSGTLLTRMIASATVQRMLKGTPDDIAARQMRRDYVWLGEQVPPLADQGRWQESIIRYGEWDAMLRAADDAAVARTPPADWTPKNPQSLLISEERTPAK